ncbi:MAG TPA: extracellular solute-binding protein [Chloroflexota bacterium]|jgi:ABC-type Fe3+ transport system substrate-binding protein
MRLATQLSTLVTALALLLAACGAPAAGPSGAAPSAAKPASGGTASGGATSSGAPSGAAPSAAATSGGGAATAGASSEFQKVLDAAKQEASDGTLFVSITQPNQASTYDALFAEFNKRFGLNVRHEWQSHQQDYYTRVIAEAQAGRRTPDVISGGLDSMVTLDDAGLLESYDWMGVFGQELPGIADPVDRTLSTLRGKSLAHFDVIYTIVYNTSALQASQLPRMLNDIADPQWDRKFAINFSGGPIDTIGIAIGYDPAMDLARKVKANRPLFKRGAPGVVASVASGEAPLGFGYTTGADVEKAKGAPIDWMPLQDYLPILQQNVTVLKSAQHPNLARLFAAWLVSEAMPLQEKLEYMGRATARGTPTWERLQQLAPNTKIVEGRTPEEIDLRLRLTDEMTKLMAQ